MYDENLMFRFAACAESYLGEPFTQDPFLLACLDEAVRLSQVSTVNGVEMSVVFPGDEIFKAILSLWEAHVSVCIAVHESLRPATFGFHGAEVPDNPEFRQECKALFARLSGLKLPAEE